MDVEELRPSQESSCAPPHSAIAAPGVEHHWQRKISAASTRSTSDNSKSSRSTGALHLDINSPTEDTQRASHQSFYPSQQDGHPTAQENVEPRTPHVDIHVESVERLGMAAQQISSHQTVFATLRGQALLSRNQLAYKRHQLHQQQSFVLESMQRAIGEFQNLPDNFSLVEFLPYLKNIKEPLEQDHRRLKELITEVDILEEALSSIEYQMQQEETKLAEMALKTSRVIDGMNIEIPDELKPGAGGQEKELDLAPGVSDVSAVHPLLLDFYDKLGDVKVMQGRLVDFEAEYSEARTERIWNEEHEVPLQQSWEEFQESWERERILTKQALTQTMDVADAAKAACLDANLDPQSYKNDLLEHGFTRDSRSSASQGLDIANNDNPPPHPLEEDLEEPPNTLTMAFKRSDLIHTPFMRPDFLDGHRQYSMDRLEPDSRAESVVGSQMGQSLERINDWMLKIPEYEKTRLPSREFAGSATRKRSCLSRTTSLPVGFRMETVQSHPTPIDSSRYRGESAAHEERPHQLRRRSSDTELLPLSSMVSVPHRDAFKNLKEGSLVSPVA